MLKILGLWDSREDEVGTFSKGMKQKSAIARALLHGPKVSFMDEPTAGLDHEASKLVRDFIKELKGEGRTIFICTDNLDKADWLCDRIAVFKTKLRVVDTPTRLRDQLSGRQEVFLFKSEAAVISDLITELPFVEYVEPNDKKLIVAVGPEEQNPHIIRKLDENGAEIQFVGEFRHPFEDIYLQMVRDDHEED